MNGWVFTKKHFKAEVDFKKEITYKFFRYIIDAIMIIPLLLYVIFLKFFQKDNTGKIIFGTNPIITFKILSRFLNKNGFNTTSFVFVDWTNKNHHNGLTLEDICKIKFITNRPFLLGPYWAFFWALKNFKIFVLYFNGGFLERTIFWKFEPLIYKILNKKLILFPYGSDVWITFLEKKTYRKFLLSISQERYFVIDEKRLKRNYYLSKYADCIISFIDYVRVLPRNDILIYHGQLIDDLDKFSYIFKEKKISFIHFANDKFRKGSNFIEYVLKKTGIEYKIIYGALRDTVISELDHHHIYIEQISEGFFSFSAIEAMLKGKIIFSYLDKEINDFYKLVSPEYYIPFFENLPIVNVNHNNLENKILEYSEKDFFELKKLSENSRLFALELIKNNKKMYLDIFKRFI